MLFLSYLGIQLAANYKGSHLSLVSWEHIQKKRTDSLQTQGCWHKNLYDILKFTKRPKTSGIIKKIWLASEGISYLLVLFMQLWIK